MVSCCVLVLTRFDVLVKEIPKQNQGFSLLVLRENAGSEKLCTYETAVQIEPWLGHLRCKVILPRHV